MFLIFSLYDNLNNIGFVSLIFFIMLFIILLLNIIFFMILNRKNNILNDLFLAYIKNKDLTPYIKELNETEKNILRNNNDNFIKIKDENIMYQNNLSKNIIDMLTKINDTNDKKLKDISEANERKLQIIENNINEKLDKSLNERLDNSFALIGEQLSSLYESLGNLNGLQNDITSLKNTFSNIKHRGVYGERELEGILENIMTKEQYVVQYKINKDSDDMVDFAVKIPKKDTKDFIYLPVDAKFPSDRYNAIVKYSNENDINKLNEAINELKKEIKKQAKSISEKYIIPPFTTDFALMFLPTEGLFSEVLRIDDLTYEIERDYKVIIVGPTNISALLSSLSLGFKYLNISERAEEINKILQAIKKQYDNFNTEIEDTKTRLRQASDATEKLSKRNNMINNKLKNIGSDMTIEQSNNILNIENKDF